MDFLSETQSGQGALLLPAAGQFFHVRQALFANGLGNHTQHLAPPDLCARLGGFDSARLESLNWLLSGHCLSNWLPRGSLKSRRMIKTTRRWATGLPSTPTAEG